MANHLVYFRAHARKGSLVVDVKLAVLADYASVSNNNRLNVLGILQDIGAPSFPLTIPHIYAVLSCEAEPAEYGTNVSNRVALLDEDNDANEILALEGSTEIAQPRHPHDTVFVNLIVGLSSVHLRHPGNYRFSFSANDQEIASVPLRVNRLE